MTFNDFGFKKFINNGLTTRNFLDPTPIQATVIPLLKKHQNVVGIAHTGTGKTYAFLLPILNNLDYQKKNLVQGLIIAPTRELAKQIYDEAIFFKTWQPELKVGLFIGGEDNLKTAEALTKEQPLLAIGTPQKLKELYEQNLLKLTTAHWVIVDEFDMIFDLGFFNDLDYLMSKINQNATKALFSATLNPQLTPFVKKYIPRVNLFDLVQNKRITDNVKNIMIDTRNKDNQLVLSALLKSINPYMAIIFVNNKNEVEVVANWLKELGITSVGTLHGDLPPRSRAATLKRVKNNEFKFLVATDIAARGIDLEGVTHVISLGLPKDLSYYVHRAGRSGRGALTGESYVLFNTNDQEKINYLQKRGVVFQVKQLVNGEIVDQKNKASVKKNKTISNEEQVVLHKYQNKKVKPGYKKKRKQELMTIKKARRRQHIKENIEKIKKEKYKKRQKDIFGKE